ncbi:MAG: type II toxin-antitoxin system RelE/ParE family toxin [Dysgonamonadaceae bacterium]|nr:type II toxin-antitoxin system RelE/ParE family toxin [Dysgonamonadaceae bacterium]
MEEKKYRHIYLYKKYFTDLFDKQSDKVKDKIIWTFRIVETMRIVPVAYLKKIEDTDGLFEIRVLFGSDIYRIFCFFDSDALVVVENGFHKKTQKTPKQEIETALRIKKEYETEKNNKYGK